MMHTMSGMLLTQGSTSMRAQHCAPCWHCRKCCYSHKRISAHKHDIVQNLKRHNGCVEHLVIVCIAGQGRWAAPQIQRDRAVRGALWIRPLVLHADMPLIQAASKPALAHHLDTIPLLCAPKFSFRMQRASACSHALRFLPQYCR